MGRFTVENVAYSAARKALQENIDLLDPVKYKALYNLNIALAYLLNSQSKLQTDLDLLHNKIQPILVELAEDSNWRDRNPKHGD